MVHVNEISVICLSISVDKNSSRCNKGNTSRLLWFHLDSNNLPIQKGQRALQGPESRILANIVYRLQYKITIL